MLSTSNGKSTDAPTDTSIESLERPSKRRCVPSEKASASFNAAAFLDSHLAEMQKYVLLGMKPQKISLQLRHDFGVDIDSKLISNKIKNWKVNGRIKVPPVDAANSRATDTPYPPTKCMCFLFFY